MDYMVVRAKQIKPKKEPIVGVDELRSYPWLTIKPGESFMIPVAGLTVTDVAPFRNALWVLHGIRAFTRTTPAGIYVARVPE